MNLCLSAVIGIDGGSASRKLSSSLWPIRDDLASETLVVYSIPCKCGLVYTGQTGHLD
jgi:hypothetical protein